MSNDYFNQRLAEYFAAQGMKSPARDGSYILQEGVEPDGKVVYLLEKDQIGSTVAVRDPSRIAAIIEGNDRLKAELNAAAARGYKLK